MRKVKIILFQTVMISFFVQIVLVIGATANHLSGGTGYIDWYIPGSILLISFLASVPSLLLCSNKIAAVIDYRLLILLHYILLFGIVGFGGKMFYWWTSLSGFISFAISFTIIYVLVWICTLLMQRHDDRLINQALQRMQDEE